MWRIVCAIEAILLGSTGVASAESLYLTKSQYESPGDSYVFVAPYFADVATKISVSIAKATTSGGAASSATAKDFSPTSITNAIVVDKKVVFFVGCDLSSVLFAKNSITVAGVDPRAFDGQYTVTQVTPKTVEATADSATPQGTGVRGAILSANCAPAAQNASVAVSIAVSPVPKERSRAYLYLRRNAFFADSVNVGVSVDGMLSSSDTSSTQQITAILTELAQTAAAGLFNGLAAEFTSKDKRSNCFKALNDLVQSGPYYKDYEFRSIPSSIPDSRKTKSHTPFDEIESDGAYIIINRANIIDPSGDANPVKIKLKIRPRFAAMPEKIPSTHPGMVAYFPVPADVALICVVGSDKNSDGSLLSAPTILNLYTERHVLDPQRDFLTNPQDTFTFSGGFITGHKYTGQSAAKTIVDTVTAPIRAFIPSVSVNQQTQVTSGGGKPDQTTTSTTTITTAPKAQ